MGALLDKLFYTVGMIVSLGVLFTVVIVLMMVLSYWVDYYRNRNKE